MPLSKARMQERKRLDRANVKPKPEALQANSTGMENLLDTTAPPVVKPNQYLEAHLRVCPDYNPVKPKDHWQHCPYINPVLNPLDLLPNCPDGRHRW